MHIRMLTFALAISCADTSVQVLVRDGEGFGAFAVSDGQIYIAASLVHDADVSSVVVRMPASGGALTELVRTAPTDTTMMAISGTTIFWVDQFQERVLSMSTSGGVLHQVVQPKGKIFALAVDETDVFVGWEGGVERVPRDGSPTDIISTEGAESIALNASFVAWIEDYTSVNVAPRAGGSPRVLSKLASAAQIAMDAQFVYWVESSGGVVRKAPIAGGTVTTIAVGQRPMAIAIDSQSLYWVDNVTAGGVFETRLDGTETVMIAKANTPSVIAIDDANVYWFDFQDGFSIRRTHK